MKNFLLKAPFSLGMWRDVEKLLVDVRIAFLQICSNSLGLFSLYMQWEPRTTTLLERQVNS